MDDLPHVLWRLDALDAWRRDDVTPRLVRLEDSVRALVSRDAITDAVAAALRENETATQQMTLSRAQFRWAAAGILFAGVSAVAAILAVVLR